MNWIKKLFGKGDKESPSPRAVARTARQAKSEEVVDKKVRKYQKPKILLIDTPEDCLPALTEAGLNAQRGTFGRPYPGLADRDDQPVVTRADLPNYTEQEIVVVDLTRPSEKSLGEDDVKDLRRDSIFHVRETSRLIDPRPLAMHCVSSNFDRILKAGGIFVVFAQPREEQRLNKGYNELLVDNWCFLSVLSAYNLHVPFDHGKEMSTVPDLELLSQLLSRYLRGSEFTATLSAVSNIKDCNAPIARNKYGRCVALLVAPNEKGVVLILPQLKEKASFLKELILSALPSIKPELFPEFGIGAWTTHSEYELRGVTERKLQIEAAKRELEERIQALNKEIEEVRTQDGFVHDLITKSGTELVTAVRISLEKIGFTNVRTVDEEGGADNKQEDLRIEEGTPVIVGEVKGLAGMPTEDDTHQVVKYMNRRMKELDRTDIRGLVVVNHQRHIPPLDRRNDQCFTEAQIEDAKTADISLVSTWDIFRLLRGYLEHGWPVDAVKKLFFANGRLVPIPLHYERLGIVEKTAPKLGVIGVRIELAQVNVGDVLSVVTENDYKQFALDSMELNKTAVTAANKGDLVGLKAPFDIREKTVLWRVIRGWKAN